MHLSSQFIILIVIILLVAYRRVRRSVGFQAFSQRRMRFRVILFGIVGVIILAVGFLHPILFLADAVGAICGGVLAYYAIRHFKFEWRGAILYTRTHIAVETAVLLLFIGRIAYRIIETMPQNGSASTAANADSMDQYTKDPYTAAIFFVIIAYYLGYYTFLIRKGTVLTTKKEQEPGSLSEGIKQQTPSM